MPDRIRFEKLSTKWFFIALGAPSLVMLALGVLLITGQKFPFFTDYGQVFSEAAESCAGNCNEPLAGIWVAIKIIFSVICVAAIPVFIHYWQKFVQTKEKEPTQKASDVVSKKGDQTIDKK